MRAESNTPDQEPRLILSRSSASIIANELTTNTVLRKSYDAVLKDADKALSNGIVVPIPKDAGGGYTHEKHKKNYADMYNAALVYSISNEKKYAHFVKDMLLEYATLYPTLPVHPMSKEGHPAGKLFWQGLNETVWLFYTIQAYDQVKNEISKSGQNTIENKLFRNVVKFVSEDSYETFNKIHNHGTWSVASVGMTGYVLGDKDMVERAIKGSQKDGKTGFLKQLDDLFSPNGYYSEGPYYQRYAILPFIVFAEAIEENQPELHIFEHREQLLHKAVTTLLQLTNENGYFYPFNDAIKDKDYGSGELVFACNIVYERYKDESVLPVIKKHDKVSLTNAGLASANALKNHKGDTYARHSMFIADGPDGKSGGIALLRAKYANETLLDVVFKFASQGMGHGHFDRLSIMIYDQGREVLQDYGAVRFLNIEAKQGGRYLPENNSFGKQSIAHNTIIVDETSQYDGNVKKGESGNPELIFADFTNPNLQIVSAKDDYAYDGINLKRTLVVMKRTNKQPVVFDITTAKSLKKHQYDMNFQYLGQLMHTNFKYTKPECQGFLGTKNGYQHLYKLASSEAKDSLATMTFLNNRKFYSITSITDKNTELILTQIGASDPEFNLRNDLGYIIRKKNKENAVFVNIIEPHGNVDPTLETVQNPNSELEALKVLQQTDKLIAISFKFKDSPEQYLFITDASQPKSAITINGKLYSWEGNYQLVSP